MIQKKDWRDYCPPCPHTHSCEEGCKGSPLSCLGAFAAIEQMVQETGLSKRSCAGLYSAGIATSIMIPYIDVEDIAARGRCLGLKAINEIKNYQKTGISYRPLTPKELIGLKKIPSHCFLVRRAS